MHIPYLSFSVIEARWRNGLTFTEKGWVKSSRWSTDSWGLLDMYPGCDCTEEKSLVQCRACWAFLSVLVPLCRRIRSSDAQICVTSLGSSGLCSDEGRGAYYLDHCMYMRIMMFYCSYRGRWRTSKYYIASIVNLKAERLDNLVSRARTQSML